jgi:hypothetical protein
MARLVLCRGLHVTGKHQPRSRPTPQHAHHHSPGCSPEPLRPGPATALLTSKRMLQQAPSSLEATVRTSHPKCNSLAIQESCAPPEEHPTTYVGRTAPGANTHERAGPGRSRQVPRTSAAYQHRLPVPPPVPRRTFGRGPRKRHQYGGSSRGLRLHTPSAPRPCPCPCRSLRGRGGGNTGRVGSPHNAAKPLAGRRGAPAGGGQRQGATAGTGRGSAARQVLEPHVLAARAGEHAQVPPRRGVPAVALCGPGRQKRGLRDGVRRRRQRQRRRRTSGGGRE